LVIETFLYYFKLYLIFKNYNDEGDGVPPLTALF